jgi:hypothetical protein
MFTFGEAGERVIEKLLKQEYVLPGLSISQIISDMSNENLAHVKHLSNSMLSNRDWTVPTGSTLLFLALERKEDLDPADGPRDGRFRADQVKLHGLVLAPADVEQDGDGQAQEKEKKWRRIGQFSELDGAQVSPFVHYVMDKSKKEWVCIV